MNSTRVAALSMLVAALSVCTATAHDNIVQPPPVDACTLITLDEAAKIAGRTFRTARPGRQGDATTCALMGGTERNINITLSPAAAKRDSDDFRKLLIEQGEKLEPVSGIGDEAFYWGNRIQVRVRNQTIAIAYGDLNQPSARERADVLARATDRSAAQVRGRVRQQARCPAASTQPSRLIRRRLPTGPGGSAVCSV